MLWGNSWSGTTQQHCGNSQTMHSLLLHTAWNWLSTELKLNIQASFKGIRVQLNIHLPRTMECTIGLTVVCRRHTAKCWDFVARPSLALYSHALTGRWLNWSIYVHTCCGLQCRLSACLPAHLYQQSIDVIPVWPAAGWVPRLNASAVSFESQKLHVRCFIEDKFYATVCCSTKFWEQLANWANSH